MSGFACHWRQSPAQPTLEGLSQGILHSWQGILCGFRRNARLCTGMQGWIVRSPKMQLDGNRVILSCVLTIIASFKMFQLEGRGYCVSQPSSGDYRALPTTIACKCKLKGAPEPQSCKTSAKLLNPSISDMDVLHVILRLSSKKTCCTASSPNAHQHHQKWQYWSHEKWPANITKYCSRHNESNLTQYCNFDAMLQCVTELF